MAKKTKDKKKKGPKGKKARAKAKLEQVWGETYDLEERNAPQSTCVVLILVLPFYMVMYEAFVDAFLAEWKTLSRAVDV